MSNENQRRRRSSHESRKSTDERSSNSHEGEKREDLVILRRKGSMDPGETSGGSIGRSSETNYKDCRALKVQSVSQDVMSGEPIRMMGYMEKRSKLIGWKRYWFVLDGHLLTYFKSKADYENLSTFAGCITLGNVSIVRPIQIKHSKGFPMQIISRNQVYFLRCAEKSVLEEWVLALQETISIPHKISSPVWTDPGAQFYRYSFAALSQWSIEDNPEDISGSLSNLPKNFYLKHEPSSSHNNGKLNPPLKQKCQSFHTLPTQPDILTFNSPLAASGMSGSSSSLDQRPSDTSKMRYSTSMLLLESSPQATELKRELASKLSNGQTAPSRIVRSGKLEQKKKLKIIQEKSVDDPNYHRNTNSIPSSSSINDEGIYEDVDFDSWKGNGKTGNSISQSSSLASIAEGFEPTLGRHFQKGTNEDIESRKKKRGIGNFIHKIFKKENIGGECSNNKKVREPVNISGPVDLRAQRIQNQKSDIAQTPPQNHEIHNPHPMSTTTTPVKVMSASSVLSQKQTLAASGENMKQNPQLCKPNSLTFINELKNVQRRRSLPDDQEIGNEMENVELQKTRYTVPHEQKVNLTLNSSSYNEKLAKFNRLSAHLNPSFAAILNPSHQNSQMTRSISCRVKSVHDDNEPPTLPPKKKVIARIEPASPSGENPSYDTPKNNRPVNPPSDACTSEEIDSGLTFVPSVLLRRERKISLRDLLCKKNSAPEISFGKSEAESEELKLSKLLSEELVPPPRPPKNKSRNQSTTSGTEENGCLLNLPCHNYGSESDLEVDKSMDIENIDVLSEFSDTASIGEEHIYSTVAPSIETETAQNKNYVEINVSQQQDLEAVYGSIKHGKVEAILTELETVEEFEDEEAELYDEFVLPMEPFCLPIETQSEESSKCPPEIQHDPSLRHSGIDELKKYLDSEINSEEIKLNKNQDSHNRAPPALNRLGHSSAVKTLENLLKKNHV